ncbi:17209_t:CDS:10, partial [Funneliformis geosporum]
NKIQSIYDKETLQTLMHQDATSSGDKHDSILDSDLIPPARAKKISIKYLQIIPKKMLSRLFLHFECIQFKPDEENVNVEGVDNDTNNLQMTSLAYQQFTATYQKIPQENKWTLSTGKIVEDALYAFGIKCSHEQRVFTQLKEIKNFDKKELPLMPDDLLKYLNSFRKSKTSDLRELIFHPGLHNQPFDRSKNFDYDWIRNTIYNLVLEYEANHLTKDHLETFIDKAFLEIDGMEITRGESCSYASSNRKNSQRVVASTSPIKRKAMGRRGDLIIRKWHSEYGCSEAGKIFDGKNGTKIIKEGGLKMPKMLRDMFNDLCEATEMRECKIRKLETVGFIIAGLRISLIRCKSPSNNKQAKVSVSLVKNVIKLMEEEDLSEVQQLETLQNCDYESGLSTPPP